MSLPHSISCVGDSQPVGLWLDSAMVPGTTCYLRLHAPIAEQPSSAELALISGVLPELIEQLLFDTDADDKE